MGLRILQALTVLVLAALLGGCASVRLLDTQVLALAQVPPGLQLQGACYRFERSGPGRAAGRAGPGRGRPAAR